MFSFVLILTTLRQDSSLSAMLCQHTVLRTSAHQVLMRCVTGCYPTAMPNCTIEVPIDFSVEHQEDVVSSPRHLWPYVQNGYGAGTTAHSASHRRRRSRSRDVVLGPTSYHWSCSLICRICTYFVYILHMLRTEGDMTPAGSVNLRTHRAIRLQSSPRNLDNC